MKKTQARLSSTNSLQSTSTISHLKAMLSLRKINSNTLPSTTSTRSFTRNPLRMLSSKHLLRPTSRALREAFRSPFVTMCCRSAGISPESFFEVLKEKHEKDEEVNITVQVLNSLADYTSFVEMMKQYVADNS